MKNIIFLATIAMLLSCKGQIDQHEEAEKRDRDIIVEVQDCVPSFLNQYQIAEHWKNGKGSNVVIAVDEINFDLSKLQGMYNEELSIDLRNDNFALYGANPTHGTDMVCILNQIAPEAEIALVRREGSYPLSYIKTLRYADSIKADILVSAVHLAYYSDLLEDWYDRADMQIFYASPPAINDSYGGMYAHPNVQVVGAVSPGLPKSIPVITNEYITDIFLEEGYIYACDRQVYGTSPLTFIQAGIAACDLTNYSKRDL